MKCPKCGYDYCDLVADSNTTGTDFSIWRGIIGELFFRQGYLFGLSNSRKTDVEAYWVCKECKYKFKS